MFALNFSFPTAHRANLLPKFKFLAANLAHIFKFFVHKKPLYCKQIITFIAIVHQEL